MIWALIVGLVVGLLARALKPGADSMGWILTIILGIAGAYVGAFISGFFGMDATQGFSYLIFSVIGAIIILFIYELLTGKRK
ncbi:GlsB/YeaQ/YmgE family stress response membrane protein [Moraxella sp. FZLJ2107]|uniref:GlsB/YeaQ/YmgE family stress response membrane protein n=1 Tax=unclassified Moraxella TaxID=2685852 RepID=UPI00209BC32E|nr:MULTISPECIES: GlsB/YeaQ/YmgE family stress response membrane protein [unclassified Moraxella]USZ13875.1 GlsB/YeaQ/YmgE family stress response membrane protein [Moraxella sp. FZFQ2102]UTO04379.1 GlsB/YeaQ/YmgE family stress response membrane protein [Moraxella sp. FZLJ2107]UTO23212.1 GlsB/YeaQ/YmgE family stress response membrane protein [Moraxella sp. FZLJ2109]